MILGISNQPRDYAWGSKTLIPDYFNVPETGLPMAEIWFGTHPANETKVTSSGQNLVDVIGHRLSFLMKILAADAPLSIQAHPNKTQAETGFAAENAAGIPINSAMRNYRDENAKPEVIVALTNFQALCGFAPVAEISATLTDLAEHPQLSDGMKLIAKGWLQLLAESGLPALFADVIGRRGNLDGVTAELGKFADFDSRFELIDELNLRYPGDPGVVIAMFMNRVWLEPGEALFLPAGNIHAYLSGLGVEVMGASDNVLRGGLTEKHIAADELAKILDFSDGRIQKAEHRTLAKGLTQIICPVDEFMLYRAELNGSVVLADLNLPAEAILLCTSGEIAVSNSIEERAVLRRGEAAYLAADAAKFSLSGDGTIFIAFGRD